MSSRTLTPSVGNRFQTTSFQSIVIVRIREDFGALPGGLHRTIQNVDLNEVFWKDLLEQEMEKL